MVKQKQIKIKYIPTLNENSIHRMKAVEARVQRELRVLDAENCSPVVPSNCFEFYPQKAKKGVVGWVNFFKTILLELKP